MRRFLAAIETSCDETAVSVFDLQAYLAGSELGECLRAEVLASSAKLHEAYGGIVPELAAREQTLALPPLFAQALERAGTSVSELGAIAATAGPGLNGSLLVGLSFAKGIAYGAKIPLYPINHLEGHLASHELIPKEERLAEPFLSLLVSGGHTEIIRQSNGRKTLARTRDDAAGEAFDKCATLLQLPYPGGPALSELAKNGDSYRFNLPIGVPDDPKSFSFSGLKTAALRIARGLPQPLTEPDRADLAASIQWAIVRALVEKTMALTEGCSGVFVTGGVAANDSLREELSTACLSKDLRFAAAPRSLCTDNATMIGATALVQIRANLEKFKTWQPGSDLGPDAAFEISTKTSWHVS